MQFVGQSLKGVTLSGNGSFSSESKKRPSISIALYSVVEQSKGWVKNLKIPRELGI